MIGVDVGRHVTYLCLGHPAWPGNLSMSDEQAALRWFAEHRETHPVYIDRVVHERTRHVSSPNRNAIEKGTRP